MQTTQKIEGEFGCSVSLSSSPLVVHIVLLLNDTNIFWHGYRDGQQYANNINNMIEPSETYTW